MPAIGKLTFPVMLFIFVQLTVDRFDFVTPPLHTCVTGHSTDGPMVEKILGSGQYLQERLEDVDKRYSGFGKEIYAKLKLTLPSVFDKLTYYRSLSHQPLDSYAVFEDGKKMFAIQLDPLGEVIALWDNEKQVEIRTWSTDEYTEALSFIRTELLK
jgi:hypothetical protein